MLSIHNARQKAKEMARIVHLSVGAAVKVHINFTILYNLYILYINTDGLFFLPLMYIINSYAFFSKYDMNI